MLSSRVQPFSTSLLVRAGYGGGNRPQYGGDRIQEAPKYVLHIPKFMFAVTDNLSSFPPSPVVYVSNLPFQASPQDVKSAFEDFPGIQKITFGTLYSLVIYAHILNCLL